MQSTILILMLALGLPGANSCNADQQGLPRVGQTPPAPTTGEQKPAIADKEDSDDVDSNDDADEEADEADMADAEMDEVAVGELAMELPEMDEFESLDAPESDGSKAPCQAGSSPSCQGSGSCQSHSDPKLGSAGSSGHAHGLSVAQSGPLGGHMLHLKQGQNLGKVQTFTVQPGGKLTFKLSTDDGEPLVLHSPGLGDGLVALNDSDDPVLGSLIARAQAPKQAQDDRVRELEQRVKELEAQLRARGDRAPRAFARSTNPPGSAGGGDGERARAEAEAERAMAREMQTRAYTQAREYAQQARKQAEGLRQQGEELRKRVQEQTEHWRVQAQEFAKQHMAHIAEGGSAGARAPQAFMEVHPDGFHMFAPEPAEAPEAAELPEPPTGAWPSQPPDAPAPPARVRKMKTPSVSAEPQVAGAPHAEELRTTMEQMRAQMEEMREQMKALREELQSAPRKEMR